MEYAPIDRFADSFGVKRSTIYHMISDGKLRAIKMGRRTLVDCAAAREYFAAQASAPINCPRKAA